MQYAESALETVEPQMIETAACDFVFGDRWGDGERDETPLLTLKLDRFLLSRHCVTVYQFVEFLNDFGSRSDPEGRLMISLAAEISPIVWHDNRFHCKRGTNCYPINYVSWYGAEAYARWISEKMGKCFVLPSEAQWQRASMGDEGLKWSHGNHFEPGEYVFASNGPRPVDHGRPSPSGFYNLTGNVFEWCADEYRFALDHSTENALRNNRVIKGGAFILADESNLRNSKRFSCDARSCLASIGFRIAGSPDK